MNREDALNELVAVEIELIRLTNKRNDLRKFVLMQEYGPQRIPKERTVAGHTKGVPRNSVSEATIRVMKEYGRPMTVKEIATLLGQSNTDSVGQTLDRLCGKGFVHREAFSNESGRYNKWSLAVHADNSTNSNGTT